MGKEKKEEKQNKDEPRVKVFGKDVDTCGKYYGGGIVWGVVFLFAGVILLSNSLGLVSWEFWDYVWGFWPALLIIIGIRVILGHNLLSRLVILLVTLIIIGLIIIYGLIRVNSPFLFYIPQDLLNWASIFTNISN